MNRFVLNIGKIGRGMGGKYRCLAANVEGEGQSEEIPVEILCKLNQVTC